MKGAGSLLQPADRCLRRHELGAGCKREHWRDDEGIAQAYGAAARLGGSKCRFGGAGLPNPNSGRGLKGFEIGDGFGGQMEIRCRLFAAFAGSELSPRFPFSGVSDSLLPPGSSGIDDLLDIRLRRSFAVFIDQRNRKPLTG
jgi:hypothetical protein